MTDFSLFFMVIYLFIDAHIPCFGRLPFGRFAQPLFGLNSGSKIGRHDGFIKVSKAKTLLILHTTPMFTFSMNPLLWHHTGPWSSKQVFFSGSHFKDHARNNFLLWLPNWTASLAVPQSRNPQRGTATLPVPVNRSQPNLQHTWTPKSVIYFVHDPKVNSLRTREFVSMFLAMKRRYLHENSK